MIGYANNGIKFDSIICITNQVIGFNPEELTGNSFYIYLNNKVTHNFLHDPDSNEIILNEISSNELEQNIARKHLKKDGKDQSLLVFTRFDKNWNFEVYKYIINCENVW